MSNQGQQHDAIRLDCLVPQLADTSLAMVLDKDFVLLFVNQFETNKKIQIKIRCKRSIFYLHSYENSFFRKDRHKNDQDSYNKEYEFDLVEQNPMFPLKYL